MRKKNYTTKIEEKEEEKKIKLEMEKETSKVKLKRVSDEKGAGILKNEAYMCCKIFFLK
jgi:hypothetical protein